jgi:serine/threonine protein kinase
MLELDAEVKIQSVECRVTEALGMGSFGTVWAAEDLHSGLQLAVKEILCCTKNEILNATFESHLLDQLSRDRSLGPTGAQLGTDVVGTMPALAGVSSTSLHSSEPIRVRLAMTRVPGVALEDFLEARRKSARMSREVDAPTHERDRFAEAVLTTRQLIVQLAPVFQRIHRIAVHRDVNTHNILIDASNKTLPRYGIVDFGLAVDKMCWCSNDETSVTNMRPTRYGQDGVYTWKYLDIAGDCRYWPVSAWTQFLIGWREIDSNPCLEKEYKHHLDQHALGITALKVFVELLLLPLLKRSYGIDDDDDSAKLDVPAEVWAIANMWRNYWRTVGPVHKRLINTFHHGGDWDALKQMCADTNFYENIAKDLSNLREALAEAAEICQQMSTEELGSDLSTAQQSPNLMAVSARLFRSMLLLVSDGQTKDALTGTQVWEAIRCMLSVSGDTGVADSTELPVASQCSSTASTVESQGAAQTVEGQAQKLPQSLPS